MNLINSFSLSLVMLVFSVILGTAPQDNFQQNSHDNIFFSADKKIWKYDKSTNKYETLPIKATNAEFGDIYVTDDTEYIYYALYFGNSSGELHRYNVKTDVDSTLFQNPNLSRMSPPSPDNKYMILSLADPQHPEAINICILNILDGKCALSDIEVTFEYFYWLGKDEFATVLLNEVKIYQASSANAVKVLASYTSDSSLGAATITSDKKFLIIYSSGNPTNNYEPHLFQYDIEAHQMGILPKFDISHINAAINRLQISPDGTFLAYKFADNLEVSSLATGVLSMNVNNIQNFIWLSDNDILLTNVENALLGKLNRLTVNADKLTEVGLFNSEIAFVEIN